MVASLSSTTLARIIAISISFDIHLLSYNLDSDLGASNISLCNSGLAQIVSSLRLSSPPSLNGSLPIPPPTDYNLILPNQCTLRKINYHQFHLFLFRIAMVIKKFNLPFSPTLNKPWDRFYVESYEFFSLMVSKSLSIYLHNSLCHGNSHSS